MVSNGGFASFQNLSAICAQKSLVSYNRLFAVVLQLLSAICALIVWCPTTDLQAVVLQLLKRYRRAKESGVLQQTGSPTAALKIIGSPTAGSPTAALMAVLLPRSK